VWGGCSALGLEVDAGLSACSNASQLYFVWSCVMNLSFRYSWLIIFLLGFGYWLSSLFFVHNFGFVWLRVRDLKEFSLWSKTNFWQHFTGILPFFLGWSFASNSVWLLLTAVHFMIFGIISLCLLMVLFPGPFSV